jgi:TRAP-type C4-dicarboxylate transport system substrate-binding protein
MDLTGLSPTLDQAREVTDAMLPEANAALEPLGVRLIEIHPYPAQVYFCREPVTGLADLAGRKIRTRGPSDADFVSAFGGEPVSIAFPEVYTALAQGVIDCGITGTGTGNASSWNEVSTHMYTLPLAWGISGYFVNLDWWNSLEPDVRAFLEANFAEIGELGWELADELTQDGIDCNTGRPTCEIGTPDTESPMTEVPPTAEDEELRLKIAAESVVPGWVERCGESCGEVYNRLLAPITGVEYVAP